LERGQNIGCGFALSSGNGCNTSQCSNDLAILETEEVGGDGATDLQVVRGLRTKPDPPVLDATSIPVINGCWKQNVGLEPKAATVRHLTYSEGGPEGAAT
jgi:hypothetical protein